MYLREFYWKSNLQLESTCGNGHNVKTEPKPGSHIIKTICGCLSNHFWYKTVTTNKTQAKPNLNQSLAEPEQWHNFLSSKKKKGGGGGPLWRKPLFSSPAANAHIQSFWLYSVLHQIVINYLFRFDMLWFWGIHPFEENQPVEMTQERRHKQNPH